jgi:hypothetical protein
MQFIQSKNHVVRICDLASATMNTKEEEPKLFLRFQDRQPMDFTGDDARELFEDLRRFTSRSTN